jgi:hypothetical protein
MLDGCDCGLAGKQLFFQKRLEQDSAHLSRTQDGYSLF